MNEDKVMIFVGSLNLIYPNTSMLSVSKKLKFKERKTTTVFAGDCLICDCGVRKEEPT